MDGYIEEFTNLLQSVPIDELNPMDQLTVMMAFVKLIETTKPILEKYALKGACKNTFLMRINKEDNNESY